MTNTFHFIQMSGYRSREKGGIYERRNQLCPKLPKSEVKENRKKKFTHFLNKMSVLDDFDKNIFSF